MNPYFAISLTSFKQAIAYRFNIFLYSLGTLFQILVMAAIWTVLRDNNQITGALNYQELVSFSILAFSASALFSNFGVFFYLTEKIKKGDIVLELIRPVDFIFHLFFRNLGNTLFRLIFIFTPFILLGYFFFGLLPPASLGHLGATLLSLILGYGLNFLIFYLFALLSFYSLDNMGTLLLFLVSMQFLSGTVIPLDYYPDILRDVLNQLPFAKIYYQPISFYLGKLPLENLGGLLLNQGLWLVGIWLVASMAWRGLSRRLIIQGG